MYGFFFLQTFEAIEYCVYKAYRMRGAVVYWKYFPDSIGMQIYDLSTRVMGILETLVLLLIFIVLIIFFF